MGAEMGSANTMSELKDTVYFTVEYADGTDEGDSGTPYFVAHSDQLHAVTDAETWGLLMKHILEVTALALNGEDPAAFGLSTASPRIVITMEVTERCAETAQTLGQSADHIIREQGVSSRQSDWKPL
jgi:hypothetical protein